MIEHANIFYMPYLNVIGGTEQFVYEIAKKYYKYDIAVIYKTGHEKQLQRLKKFIPIYQYSGQKFKCKNLFCNYATDICKNVEAENYIQVIHAMYKTNRVKPVDEPLIKRYLAVSEIAKKEYEELTGIQCELFRNPLTFTNEDKKKPLLLISATRLTPEKGKKRMEKLAQLLDMVGAKWTWLIFTNDEQVIQHKNIAYMKPRLDIRPYLQLALGQGYGVQLSDCEGDCYFTRECEAIGLPLLVTPIPSFKEQNLEEGKNCYYLPFDMDIDIDKMDKIVNKIPKYKGYIREDRWDEILEHKLSSYKEDNMIEVEALRTYEELGAKDSELDRIPRAGERFEVSKERLEVLLGKNGFSRAFVKVVEKPIVEEKATLPKEKEVKAVLPKKTKKK